VQEDDRCSAACLFVVKPDVIQRNGIGHLHFLVSFSGAFVLTPENRS
jgi:hypothetical protein